MNICIHSASRPGWYESPEIKTKAFNNILDAWCFKITCGPLIIGYALDNQSAPIGREVERLTAHGTGGVCRARALPAVHTPGMEHVATWQCTIRLLSSHGSEAHRALRALVDPTALFTTRDLASARGSVSRLGTTSTGLH
jgi:hypothetical protein